MSAGRPPDTMRCQPVDEHGMTRAERRIAELEAALREIARLAVQQHDGGIPGDALLAIEKAARGALQNEPVN